MKKHSDFSCNDLVVAGNLQAVADACIEWAVKIIRKQRKPACIGCNRQCEDLFSIRASA